MRENDKSFETNVVFGFCKNCGKEIFKKHSTYCSDQCMNTYKRLNNDLFGTQYYIRKKCKQCGKGFESEAKNFCSLNCATTFSLNEPS